MSDREPLAYTIEQAAEVSGVSSKYLRDRINRGDLEARYAGRKILILREHLDAWLKGLPRERANS